MKIVEPDYEKLLSLIYHETGYQISFGSIAMRNRVKQIIKEWYEDIERKQNENN